MTLSFDVLLDVAHKLANAAQQITLRHFRNELSAENKSETNFDPVTIADREAEQAMRTLITDHFPDHGIAGEEFASVNSDADYVWTLDPIDGTRAYILGIPLWGTLIGLSYKGKPILGIMDQPFIGERFWNDEKSSWYRGPSGPLRRCTTRKCSTLASAYLTATTPDMFDGIDQRSFERLTKTVKMRRYGGDCYAYCLLALGQIDIVAEAQLKPYDILPLIPIIEKAGGAVMTWDGNEAMSGGRCFAVGDPNLRDQVISTLTR